MRNAWGLTLCERPDLFKLPGVERFLQDCLPMYLEAIGFEETKRSDLVARILEAAAAPTSGDEYRSVLRELVVEERDVAVLTASRDERARVAADQIQEHLAFGSVLDLGAGDGAISRLILERTGSMVVCADVFRSAEMDKLGLPFAFVKPQTAKIRVPDSSFDNVLLAAVLHHAEDPRRLLDEAVRLLKPGGHLVVLEALIDPEPGPLAWGEADRDLTEGFLALTFEARLAVTGFVDEVANTAGWSPDIHHMIRCPLNFNTVEGWEYELSTRGIETVECFGFGADQPLGAGVFHGLIRGTLA